MIISHEQIHWSSIFTLYGPCGYSLHAITPTTNRSYVGGPAGLNLHNHRISHRPAIFSHTWSKSRRWFLFGQHVSNLGSTTWCWSRETKNRFICHPSLLSSPLLSSPLLSSPLLSSPLLSSPLLSSPLLSSPLLSSPTLYLLFVYLSLPLSLTLSVYLSPIPLSPLSLPFSLLPLSISHVSHHLSLPPSLHLSISRSHLSGKIVIHTGTLRTDTDCSTNLQLLLLP